ncbi:RNA 2',3'-cyclic phosphodiesterase [Blastochloris tepida]|uniref:RNA 2',3'-cyclic phosphodiesterase n=1 Tax=Blastochloris tepida TaxID=2233851 RepID=A0A348G529_9HYPH|nr:RNA 2',3'-cyclic phosphodiesterase [Blastochloris tepida]BBF94662.1 RNA 2',3'-cyclic phosphodiesterase [Blastochloris tepida]
MPRLFTGLEIPAEIGASLMLLRGGLPGARWVEPGDFHITLRFIGDVDDRTAGEVTQMLAGISRRSFEVSLVGLDAFGGNKPRAVYVPVEAPPLLMELQAEHERLMQRIGLPAESRNYRPHVTLARLRDTSPRVVADYLATRGLYRSPPIRVGRFVLFSSRASVGGGPYVVEAAYPLL